MCQSPPKKCLAPLSLRCDRGSRCAAQRAPPRARPGLELYATTSTAQLATTLRARSSPLRATSAGPDPHYELVGRDHSLSKPFLTMLFAAATIAHVGVARCP